MGRTAFQRERVAMDGASQDLLAGAAVAPKRPVIEHGVFRWICRPSPRPWLAEARVTAVLVHLIGGRIRGLHPGYGGLSVSERRNGLARLRAGQAIRKLVSLMRSKETSELTQFYAAQELLNRGHGRPATAVTGEGDTGPAKIEFTVVQEFHA
jgi:hypothetical protein